MNKVIISREEYEESLNDFIHKEMYKKRIEKAIEYIRKNMNEEYIHTDYVCTMIKILQGSDDNENIIQQ